MYFCAFSAVPDINSLCGHDLKVLIRVLWIDVYLLITIFQNLRITAESDKGGGK
jgi:hypothetical protein